MQQEESINLPLLALVSAAVLFLREKSSKQDRTCGPISIFSVQELREMVMKGPFEHPGANAVEDENGRLVNLTHMSLQATFSSLL